MANVNRLEVSNFIVISFTLQSTIAELNLASLTKSIGGTRFHARKGHVQQDAPPSRMLLHFGGDKLTSQVGHDVCSRSIA